MVWLSVNPICEDYRSPSNEDNRVLDGAINNDREKIPIAPFLTPISTGCIYIVHAIH